VRIVVTDSGLGGLSVLAELESRLRGNPVFRNAELIFFNSLYSHELGYNTIESFSDKVIIFNNALNSIEANYNPDLILIACNTLSVVYPHTEFAKNSETEVKGIVDGGVSLFANNLQNKSDKIILFGTPTTINSDVYKQLLVKAGIEETQIVNQECLELESVIQNNPNSDKTNRLIAEFVQKASELISSDSKNIYAGLCCTHYGYSESFFYTELSKQFNSNVKILNPNSKMLDYLFDSKVVSNNCKTIVKVISQVKLRKNEIKLLSDILLKDSPKTSVALENYEFIENLFQKK